MSYSNRNLQSYNAQVSSTNHPRPNQCTSKWLLFCLSPLILCAILMCNAALAQQDMSKVEIRTTRLTDNVYMLTGRGGNIAVLTGDDGVFMIDDQFAPLSDKIINAIAEISDKPVTYLLNTHWHGDHTGGNENFGNSGAVIVSHDNVRKRLSTKQTIKAFNRQVPAASAAALPDITYASDATFYFNNTTVQLIHVENAHTDGDSLVYFTESNVLHMGDIFFNGFFPFIDQSSGGSLDGVIAATDKALSLINDNTQIIPGHGPMGDKKSLQEYRAMLLDVKNAMAPHINANKSRDDVIAAEPLKAIGSKWGNGFLKTDAFTGIVFDLETGGQ